MHPSTPKPDLAILLAEAQRAAMRLRRRLALPAADLNDLQQELLLDLIRRLPQFDPGRGSLGTFAGVVLRNRSSRIAARVARERRAWGGALLSLDAPALDRETIGERMGEGDGLSTWLGGAEPALQAERRNDIHRALARLDRRDQVLCAAVARWPVERLAERGFGSRAGIYRRLRELRHMLAASGLQAA